MLFRRALLTLAVLAFLAAPALAACSASPAPAAPIPSVAASTAAAPVASTARPTSAMAPAASASPTLAAPPEEPQGSVLTNAVTTSSSSVADADVAIAAVRPKLRRCYESARGNGPEIVGMVTCGVRITKAGKVGAVGVTRRNSLPKPLADCIVRELSSAVFRPREEEAVIMVPVRFGTLPVD